MAEAAVTCLLNKITNFLDKEIHLFKSIQEEVVSVRNEIAHADVLLRTVDSFAETDVELMLWVGQIRDVAYDIEDVLDEFKLLSEQLAGDGVHGVLSKFGMSIRHMKARYRIIYDLKRASSMIQVLLGGLEGQAQKFRGLGLDDPPDSADNPPRWSGRLVVEDLSPVGIEKPKRVLAKWLVEGPKGREVVSIVGMGGLGKTTLINQVYNDPAVKKHFAIRAWVTFSPSSTTEEILEDMLQQIACQIRKSAPRRLGSSNSDWLRLLIKACLLHRRYLIVLDDMWIISKWDAIKDVFPSDGCGSRVVVSTRHANIASAACGDFSHKVYYLEPLPDEESWKLFCRKVFVGTGRCPPHLEEISKCILRKCMGLPLAIVAISGVLASKDTDRIDKWDLVFRSLRAAKDDNDILHKINKVLSHSFNDLPYYLKSCFLHLSVFPEGHGIERARLIRLWVAEGFVESKEGRTLEEVAGDYLNELSNRSLLRVAERTTDGRVKVYRMHNILQQIAIMKSKEQNFAARLDEQAAVWPDKVRRLSVHNRSQSLQQKRPLSQLRSLFMSRGEKSSIRAALLCDLKLLAILDMQAASLRKFPVEVLDMCSLKYLSLRCTEVKTVPSSIGKLRNLETLDLKHTYVTELPIEIMKLQRLRHLLVYRYETTWFSYSKYGFRTNADIGCLQFLQKLCYIEADDERSRMVLTDIGKMSQLRRLCILKLKKEDGEALCSSIAKLTNLVSLSVSSSEEDEVLDLQDLSCPPPLLQRIYLTGRLLAMPQWIPNLDSIITLHLRLCCLKVDPLLLLQNLPNLVHLEMKKVYEWKLLSIQATGFRKLKRLGLQDFHGLTDIEVEEGAMPDLVQLIIHECKLLRGVPLGIQHLTKLKLLEMIDVHDDLVTKLEMEAQSEDYQKVAEIPEVRYGSWTEGGWDIKSLEKSCAKLDFLGREIVGDKSNVASCEN